MTETWIGLAAALFAGAGLKAVEAFLNRSKRRFNIGTQLRDELRNEIDKLRKEQERLKEDLDSIRERYYNLLALYERLKLKMIQLGESEAVDKMEEEYDEFK